VRYFGKTSEDEESFFLYTNVYLGDSKKKDGHSHIYELYKLFKDFAALGVGSLVVVRVNPLVFVFRRKQEDDKNWNDLLQDILIVFQMHMDQQDLSGVLIEDGTLPSMTEIPQEVGKAFIFDLSNYRYDYRISDDEDDIFFEYYVFIRHHFKEGQMRGATHMLIVDETEKETFSVIYVSAGEDPLEMFLAFDDEDDGLNIADVYFLHKSLEDQLPEE